MRRNPSRFLTLLAGTILGLCAFTGPFSSLRAEDLKDISGSIRGRVLDENGQALEGACVRISKPGDTEPRRETTSADQGAYWFPHVDPGLYVLEVEHQGFQSTQRVVIVSYEGRTTMDVNLRPEPPRSPSTR